MRGFLFFFFILLPLTSFSKSVETFGVVPFLSLSKGLATNYDLNFYHSDSFNLTERQVDGKHYPARDRQTYFQTSIAYKPRSYLNVALGHIYQRNNPLDVDFSNEHRIFEQVTYLQNLDALRLTHRVRFEQRFVDERKEHEFKTRLRYQIGASFPLDGRQLDPGEFYVNCYNEFYFSTTGERNAFYSDDWAYAGVGYQTLSWGRLEAGPIAQYSIINRDKDISAFYGLQFGWILKFK
jgi:hypothetical protein